MKNPNNNETLPTKIPSKDLPFSVKLTGTTYGGTFEGDFVVRVPSLRQISQIGVENARLCGGVRPDWLDDSTATIYNMVSFLRVSLLEAPGWFKNLPDHEDTPGMDYGLDTEEYNIGAEIFQKANQLVEDWKNALQPKAKKK